MSNRLLQRLGTTVTGGAILIAAGSLVSRLLGLVRDRMLFGRFPVDQLDTYYVAFRLPDLIFNILVLGVLSSAFIPVFIETRKRENDTDHDVSWRLANSVLNILLAALFFLAALAFVFAPHIVPLFAPGFSGGKLHETVELTRVMLLAILFFGVSNVISSILNSFKRFFAFAFAPVLYNVGIILGLVVLAPTMGMAGLAWGVVFGAGLHLLIQLPGAFRIGFRYRWQFRWSESGVRKVFRLMLPRTLGLGVVQIEQLVSTMIASILAAGSVAIFSAANNLQSFPINIFGVSLAISSFPVFSEAFAEKNTPKFVLEFSKVFRRILFFIVPVSVLILLLRAQIVRVVLGSGEFGWNETILTAQTLGFFSLALFAQSLLPTLTRSFYALQDTVTPVKVSIVGVVLNIIGGLTLGRMMGVTGLALSFSVASAVQMLTLLVLLRSRLGDLDDDIILSSAIKIIVASGVMAVATWAALQGLALGVNQRTFAGIFVQGVVAGLAGTVTYLAITTLFRFDEMRLIRSWIGRARQVLSGSAKKKTG